MPDTEKVRLLICRECQSIEELPWYEGPQEYDDTGNYRISFHQYPGGRYHPTVVGDILKADWDTPNRRQAVIEKLSVAAGMPGDGAGLGQAFYDVKSNFQTDAITCWKQHNRTHNCDDYMSESKRLLPNTRAERKAEGLPARRPSTFLCQFCPVHSLVIQRQRKANGYYDKKPWEPSS